MSEHEPDAPDPPVLDAASADDPESLAWAELERLAGSDDKDDFFESLRRVFAREITPSTYSGVLSGPGTLIGGKALVYVVWLARRNEEDRAKSLAEQGASPEAVALVRQTIALFGPELSRAWAIWARGDAAHDWWHVTHRISRTVGDDDYLLTVMIHKKNDESVKLELDQDSLLRLISRLLRPLNEVDDPATFDREDLDEFLETADTLRSRTTS